MKTFKLFSMAALALVLTACSNNDDEILQPAEQGKMHFTATLAAPNSGATTRTTATADGDNYNVAWAVDDEIALVYEDKNGIRVWDKATVTAVDDVTGAATITAVLNYSVNDNTPVTLVYPYNIVYTANPDALSGKDYEPETGRFRGQGLSSISSGFTQDYALDWRDGSGTFSVDGPNVTLSGNVTMNPNVAIWKINLTTDGTTPLEVVQVSLNVGNVSGIISGFYSGSSTVYFFVPPYMINQIYTIYGPGQLFSITALQYGQYYTYSYNSQVSLTAGKIYESTLTLTALQQGWIQDSSYDGAYIYYISGESWADAIANHPGDNGGDWVIQDGKVFCYYMGKYLKDAAGNAYIDPTTAIDPNATYSWVD